MFKFWQWFCDHKFRETEDKKNLFCPRCGAVRQIPCNHVDVTIRTLERDGHYNINAISGLMYINRCTKCGRISKTECN